MTRILGLAALALVTAQTPARVDDAVTVKVKLPAEGDTVLVDKTTTQVTHLEVLDATGKTVSKEITTTKEIYLYIETILAKEAGKPVAKLRREYEKATHLKGDAMVAYPFQGKALLVEKKGGKFHFFIEGGKELTEKDVPYLNEEFNTAGDDSRDMEKHFLPSKPVKVGEVYRLDMPSLVKSLTSTINMEGDAAKAEGTGRLVKAYTKDERPFGQLTVHMAIPLTRLTEDNKKLAALEGSKITGDVNLDLRIDGLAIHNTSKSSLKIDLSTMIPLPDKSMGKFIFTIRNDEDEIDKELPKK